MPKKTNQTKEQQKKQDANANQNASAPSKITVIPQNADSADEKKDSSKESDVDDEM